ncbi:MAG: UDP-glucose 4-epimerase GalE [Clostridia bacterium]|nr:UDP-glucose 4-epimerase GalE [Clostridia bacterium]
MSILITGGAGFIGSHTCVEMLNAGKDIVVIDNYANSSPKACERVKQITGKDFPYIECDIRDEEKLGEIFAGYDIEAVIHFAGLKAVGESCQKPVEYYDNNVGGTVTLLKAMKKAGVKTIIFSSSATVYGGTNPVPFKEDMPTGGTTNPYGTTKLFIEQILKDLCAADKDWSACLLRYFNPIGAHESGLIGEAPNGIPNNLMPYIAQVAVGKLKELRVFGNDYDTPDGTGVRDYIHVVDLAKGHVCACDRALKVKGCEIFNLGTGRGVSVLELIRAFENANGIKIPYVIAPRRPGDIDASFADVSKAREVLGWQTEKDAVDACRDTWNWQKNNPNGYDD